MFTPKAGGKPNQPGAVIVCSPRHPRSAKSCEIQFHLRIFNKPKIKYLSMFVIFHN